MHLGDLYKRPTIRQEGRWYDQISKAYCATQFSIARFWTPWHANADWSIFLDGDFLIRHDIEDLVRQLDDTYALMCVQHNFVPQDSSKMDNQVQTQYERKAWSSLMAFNNRHQGTHRLILSGELNTQSGLFLHQLRWLKDSEIGALDPAWNWLEGSGSPEEPKAVHFTRGTPDMPGYDGTKYAKEWWQYV